MPWGHLCGLCFSSKGSPENDFLSFITQDKKRSEVRERVREVDQKQSLNSFGNHWNHIVCPQKNLKQKTFKIHHSRYTLRTLKMTSSGLLWMIKSSSLLSDFYLETIPSVYGFPLRDKPKNTIGCSVEPAWHLFLSSHTVLYQEGALRTLRRNMTMIPRQHGLH